jgi:type VI secretion system protein ImpJ
MQFPAVNWHEGLFLQPHHFQAWDRHWTERICTGERWQAPHSYGVLEFEINTDALAAGFLQVDVLRCKTPNGALIEWLHGGGSERRDLRPALEQAIHASAEVPQSSSSAWQDRSHHAVDVYVGVPRLKLGNQNVDSPEHRNGSRFRAQWLDLPDETDAASVQPVELRELNARLLLSTDDLAGFDVLRLARVRRSEQDDVQVKLDPHYIPPLMDCAASSLLKTQILSSLYDLLQQYSEMYAKQVMDAGGLHANTPVDIQRLMLLQIVNPVASVLRVLAHSKGIHPMTLYIELARLAGSLDLLHPNRVAKPTAPYDHENLGGILFELKRRVVNAVEGLHKAPYRQCVFLGNERGLQVSLDRSMMNSVKRWFIGVHQTSMSVDALQRLLTSGQLDWKIGSVESVERLFTMRAPGIEIKRSPDIPGVLPKASNWHYFEIASTDVPAWQDVKSTGTMAIRFRDSLLVHQDEHIGAKEIQLQMGQEVVGLQFALFGVT